MKEVIKPTYEELQQRVKDLELECCCDQCSSISVGTIFSWVNGIGHAIIETIELQIGGYVIDKQYGEWFDIWSELTQTSTNTIDYWFSWVLAAAYPYAGSSLGSPWLLGWLGSSLGSGSWPG